MVDLSHLSNQSRWDGLKLHCGRHTRADICFEHSARNTNELIAPSIHPSLFLGPFPACTELGAPPVGVMELVKCFHGISVKNQGSLMLRHGCAWEDNVQNQIWQSFLAQTVLLKEERILRVSSGLNDTTCDVRSPENKSCIYPFKWGLYLCTHATNKFMLEVVKLVLKT